MQAFGFTGEDFKPVLKPEPTKSKGGFYSFGKNSKSSISAMSKEERDEKNRKLAEFRKVIGKQDEGHEAIDLTLTKERALEVALKRAN